MADQPGPRLRPPRLGPRPGGGVPRGAGPAHRGAAEPGVTTADVLVVGAGPAGYVGAIRLARLGRKVVLVDHDKLGGECLNYGCIPSKALINASWLAHRVGKGLQPGLTAEGVRMDGARLQAWKSQLLGALARNIGTLAKANGVEVMAGSAEFTSPREARVVAGARTETVGFQNALIATGTRPIALPGFPFDGRWCLSSREALDLKEPPAALAVIGGGAIGLELGTIFAKLGSKVTVVEFMPQILPGLESDLAAVVSRSLQRLGVEVLVGSRAKAPGTAGSGTSPAAPGDPKRPSGATPGTAGSGTSPAAPGREILVETPQGERTVEASAVIVSVGRAPSTQGLGLEAAGVRTDAKGHIVIDRSCRTSAGHIFAAGDIAGPPYLAHKASAEALLAAEAITGAAPRDLGPVPAAVFTDPEVATVGETESQAAERGAETIAGRFPFAACGRAQAMRETEGFVKVVAEKSSHLILGVSIVGPHAGDIIGEACLALRLKARLEDVAHTMHPHPTLPEAFMEACEAALGSAIHILPAR
ncbi:MAG: dihydrolipoyl dehydrogenase [Elusimicrobia bacterium]|nr:dihydrolipoyl dehydrogenase [Elusimicrobiota bacterium]